MPQHPLLIKRVTMFLISTSLDVFELQTVGQYFALPPLSAAGIIESVPSVCVSVSHPGSGGTHILTCANAIFHDVMMCHGCRERTNNVGGA